MNMNMNMNIKGKKWFNGSVPDCKVAVTGSNPDLPQPRAKLCISQKWIATWNGTVLYHGLASEQRDRN
jgi:hypothetical protein